MAGCISVLPFLAMREYSDFIILGEDYVDLLGSCTKILFRIFVNLCNKICVSTGINRDVIESDDHMY